MTFAWTNLSKSTMRELAKGAGLVLGRAEQELTEKYGAIPGEQLVADLWPVLRDGWVTREPVARRDVVDGLRAARLGDLSIKVGTRTGQLNYLRTCRMSATLKSVVLAALLKVGSLPWDAPAEMVGKPEEELVLPMVEWLRRTCAGLTMESIPVVELAVALGIGRALKGVTVPVSDENRPEIVNAVVQAAILSAHAHIGERASFEGDPPPHFAWVLEGADRLARDRTLREQAVAYYVGEVDAILGGDTPDAFNAAMTSLSMFITTIAFGANAQPTHEQSVQLVQELSPLLDILEPSGTDAPSELRDDTATPAAPRQADDGEEQTVAEFITESISDVVGLRGPLVNEGIISWLMPAGSALVQVLVIDREEHPTVIRYYAALLNGVTPSPELLAALNMINAKEEYVKVYLVEERVVMEYDQIFDQLTVSRLRTTLGSFLGMADHFDNVLQDRFGGQTQAAPVKAQFDA